MARYGVSDVWTAFEATASMRYGETAFQRVAGRKQLRQRLEYWLTQEDYPLDGETDVQDAADDFLAHHEYDFQPTEGSDSGEPSARVVVKSRGSLARVVAYAEALPAVLRAREEVLGTREPLPYAEAIEWLVQETQNPEEHVLIELKFRFLVPKTSPVLWTVQSGMPGPELLNSLDKESIHTPIAPGARKLSKRPTERSLTLLVGPDDKRVEVDLLRGNSDKLSALLFWANRLAGRCVGGGNPKDDLGNQEGFVHAVWLILAGIWPRISVEALVYPWNRGACLVADDRRLSPQTPYMVIRVEAMDTPPDVVSHAYQSLRKAAKLSRPGGPIEPKSEVLCTAALDAQEIDGVREGSPGFIEAVLRRYRAKAEDHGVEPSAFPDTPAGHSKARHVLARARKTYGKRYSEWISAGAADTARSEVSMGPQSLF